MNKLRILELFSGIGSVHKAFTNLGIDIEVVDAIEIDKSAMTSYNAIHGTNFTTQDIKSWDKELNNIDLIWNSSPCTDFSMSGKNKGADVNSGTPSSLIYEAIRIIKKIKPKYVIWENVKGLTQKKHINILNEYIEQLESVGYKSSWKTLNAIDYGIPQNRERVFVVSYLEGDYKFPSDKNIISLEEFLNKHNSLEYRIDDIIVSNDIKPSVRINFEREKYSIASTEKPIYQCKSSSGWNDNKVGIKYTPTLRANNNYCSILYKNIIRKITPLESFLLTGFTQDDYNKVVESGVTKTNIYKQAGNSVVVNVVMALLNNLL